MWIAMFKRGWALPLFDENKKVMVFETTEEAEAYIKEDLNNQVDNFDLWELANTDPV